MTLDGHLKTGLMFALVIYSLPSEVIPTEFKTVLAITILVGNIAPDFLELGIIPHRTYTHYPIGWALILSVAYAAISTGVGTNFFPVTTWWGIAGVSTGCLWHIFCDWPYYGGIPLWSPTRKIALFRWEFDGPMNRIFEHSMLLVGLGIILFKDVSAIFDISPITFP